MSFNLIPIVPIPLKDECLTSWLFRLAKGLDTKLHTLNRYYWPKHEIWTRVIELTISKELLNEISLKSGLTVRQVRKMTLLPYNGKIVERLTSLRANNWILNQSNFHRHKRKSNTVFCPHCLEKDAIKYFRTSWRLSFNTVCLNCGYELLDRCSFCESSVDFARLDFGNKNQLISYDINECFSCKKALNESISQLASKKDLYSNLLLWERINTGYSYPGLFSFSYFQVLYNICSALLRKTKYSHLLRQAIQDNYQTEDLSYLTEYICFEHVPVKGRRQIITTVVPLLEKWPNRFLQFSKKYSLTLSAFKDSTFKSQNFWFESILQKIRSIDH